MTPSRRKFAMLPMDSQVRPHFRVSELACPCCGIFVYNSYTLDMLESFRDAVQSPVQVTSGSRCVRHNKEVGGFPNSAHLYGTGFDVLPPAGLLGTWSRHAERVGFHHVVLYHDDGHLHLGA